MIRHGFNKQEWNLVVEVFHISKHSAWQVANTIKIRKEEYEKGNTVDNDSGNSITDTPS